MTTQSGRSQFMHVAAAMALLLGFCSSAAIASSGVAAGNDEVTDALPAPALPSPSLNIKMTDRGLVSAAADMQASAAELSADKVASPALAEDIELTEDQEDDDQGAGGNPVTDAPETALRLPGVAEQDLPHFRRQMYRTDI